MIDLSAVCKVFPGMDGGFTALNKIDLNIPDGEFVAIVGKSGSGKSTLINLIVGIDRPTAGDIRVAGTAINTLNESQLALWRGRHVGVVFQFFQLLPTLSVIENVMLPMDFCGTYSPQAARTRAMLLLDQVGIAEQAAKLPSALSGGQQQRAAIARALANDPGLIVADEPTGNLDSHTAEMVMQQLANLSRMGKTVVMVTHERDLTHIANRTVTLSDGRVIDQVFKQGMELTKK